MRSVRSLFAIHRAVAHFVGCKTSHGPTVTRQTGTAGSAIHTIDHAASTNHGAVAKVQTQTPQVTRQTGSDPRHSRMCG